MQLSAPPALSAGGAPPVVARAEPATVVPTCVEPCPDLLVLQSIQLRNGLARRIGKSAYGFETGTSRDSVAKIMRPPFLGTVALIGLGFASGAAACGADDGSKKQQAPRSGDAGDDSGGSGMGGEPEGGGPSAPGGSGVGAIAGIGGSNVAGGGGAPTAEGGSAGAEPLGGAGGTPEPGPRECPTGSADCDDDHDDCETNTATDAENCGRCERACGGTATCSSGLCGATPILAPSGSSNYCDGAFSPTTAYLLTCWGGFTEIRTTPVAPGPTILGTQIATYSVPVTAARGMLIDGDDVLFGVQGNPSYLYKFPLNADGPEDVTVAYTFENATRFDGIQLIGDTFYWNNNSHTAAGQVQPGFIRKRAKTGVSSTTLVSGLGLNYDLQVFDDSMVWLELRSTNDVLSVYRAPLAGALVADVELVAAAVAGGYMVRHGAYAYWTHKAAAPNGKIRRLKVDDAAAEVEDIATNLNLPEGLIADESYLYFKQLDALYRAPLGGGAPEQLSPPVPANDSQATQIHYVDGQYVYFVAGPSGGSSTVVRVAK